MVVVVEQAVELEEDGSAEMEIKPSFLIVVYSCLFPQKEREKERMILVTENDRYEQE